MVLIAVVDAQMKSMPVTEDMIKKSKWWKGFRKPSHEL
jgi:hypothetical protein